MLFSYREPPDLKGLAGHAFCEVVIAAFASLGACRCAGCCRLRLSSLGVGLAAICELCSFAGLHHLGSVELLISRRGRRVPV